MRLRQVVTSQAALLAALAIVTAQPGAAQSPDFRTLYSFRGGADGEKPNGVILGQHGSLYGTTYLGGLNLCGYYGNYLCGTVFELMPAAGPSWSKTVLYNFSGPDGAAPDASLVFGPNGAIYGTTLDGGGSYESNGGTVFQLTPPATAGGTWTETVLYYSPGRDGSPEALYGSVLIGPDGALYATTYSDGYGSNLLPTGGTVFMLKPSAAVGQRWPVSYLLNFLPVTSLGTRPSASLVMTRGSLFGTTSCDSDSSCGTGGNGCGAVFELTPPETAGDPWAATLLHSFGTVPGDGGGPRASLTVGSRGELYGTTYYGGAGTVCTLPDGAGCGTVFQLTPPVSPSGSWTEKVVYSFTGSAGDGAYPAANLVLGADGTLYGTTQYGGGATSGSSCTYYGVSGCGTVFALTPPSTPGGAWTETVLHSFTGQNDDGSEPVAGLTISPGGVLYGATQAGGTSGKGTVFGLRP